MNKKKYIEELRYLLQDLEGNELEDAIHYYEDYIDAASDEDNIKGIELGSPEKVAAIIRADLQGFIKDKGEFNEIGYSNPIYAEPLKEVGQYTEIMKTEEDVQYKDKSTSILGSILSKFLKLSRAKKIFLIIIICIIFSEYFTIFGEIDEIIVGVLGSVISILIFPAVLALAGIAGGIIILFRGVLSLFSDVLYGIFSIGMGTAILGMGFIGVVLSCKLYGNVYPRIWRKIVGLKNRK
jgi:Predicted membrane protein